MIEIGHWMSSEEHTPNDLVRHARRAEELGFSFSMISDHFHPWIDAQGHAPFVWSVIGGVSQVTQRIKLGTGVTCPTIRIHPAIIAQAAATSAAMMPGRFLLGLGTGENLNEHILGDRWPPVSIRQEMLVESVEVIRELWQGKLTSHYGDYYTVENARLYTLPEQLPPILIAAGGPESAELAGQIGDGLIVTGPDPEVVQIFESAGGKGKPRYGKITACWAKEESSARRTAFEYWPTAALRGPVNTELPLPQHFEQAAQSVTEEQVAEAVIVGPDPQPYLKAIKSFAEAGFTHVSLHQIGPDQDGFFDFYQRELRPQL